MVSRMFLMYGIYLAVRILDEILFEVDKSEIVLLA
jgi:hypothetical protein